MRALTSASFGRPYVGYVDRHRMSKEAYKWWRADQSRQPSSHGANVASTRAHSRQTHGSSNSPPSQREESFSFRPPSASKPQPYSSQPQQPPPRPPSARREPHTSHGNHLTSSNNTSSPAIRPPWAIEEDFEAAAKIQEKKARAAQAAQAAEEAQRKKREAQRALEKRPQWHDPVIPAPHEASPTVSFTPHPSQVRARQQAEAGSSAPKPRPKWSDPILPTSSAAPASEPAFVVDFDAQGERRLGYQEAHPEGPVSSNQREPPRVSRPAKQPPPSASSLPSGDLRSIDKVKPREDSLAAQRSAQERMKSAAIQKSAKRSTDRPLPPAAPSSRPPAGNMQTRRHADVDPNRFLDHPDDATMSMDCSGEGDEWTAEDEAIRLHSPAPNPDSASNRQLPKQPQASSISGKSKADQMKEVDLGREPDAAAIPVEVKGGVKEMATRNVELANENKVLKKELQRLKDVLSGSAPTSSNSSNSNHQDGSQSTNRLRGMNAQLQRQVALMSEELRGCSDLVLEAESIMEETSRKMEEVISNPIFSINPHASSSHHEGSGLGGDVRNVAMDLHRFARQMLARIKSGRAVDARQGARSGIEERRRREEEDGRKGFGGSESRNNPWLRYEVPFVPAGGNRFLNCLKGAPWTDSNSNSNPTLPHSQPSAISNHVLSLTDIVEGRGGSALLQLIALSSASPSGHYQPAPSGLGPSGRPSSASPSRFHVSTAPQAIINNPEAAARASSEIQGLERRLSDLGPVLHRLLLTLKTLILPAMPWISTASSASSLYQRDSSLQQLGDDQRILSMVAAAVESVTLASRPLSELCALIGSPTSHLSESRGEIQERAATAEAGRDAWLWSQQGQTDDPAEDLQGGDETGGFDLSRVSSSISRTTLKSLSKGNAPNTGLPEKIQASREALESALSLAIDRHLGPEARRVADRLNLMDAELKLLCQASALHSKTVGSLIKTTSDAVIVVRDSGGDASGGGGRDLIGAADALRGVLSALDRLDHGLNEATLRDLVSELREGREVLILAPDAIESVGLMQADLEGRLAARIASLSPVFEKAVVGIGEKRQQAREKLPIQMPVQIENRGQVGDGYRNGGIRAEWNS